MSADLAAFLAACYDEAEVNLRYAGEGRIAWLTYNLPDGQLSHTTVAADHDDEYWCADGKLLPEPASVRVVYEQANRLADIRLKRAILAEHASTVTKREQYPFDPSTGEPIPDEYDGDCATCGWFDAATGGCATVRQLGTEFTDKPGYRSEWAP